jgi:DNA replication protein DnaC
MKSISDLMPKSFAPARTPAEMAEYLWKKETLPRMRDAGLDVRFCERIDFKTQNKQRAVYRRVWKRCAGVGAIVALVGPRGTGKTTIAAQIIRSRAESPDLPPWERQPPYRKLADLTARFKALYADFGSIDIDRLRDARERYADISLHVIDEVHECEDQKFAHRVLTDLIDRCYAKRTDVILISNQTPEEFRASISDSIRSRLMEHGEIIECDWPTFRVPK